MKLPTSELVKIMARLSDPDITDEQLCDIYTGAAASRAGYDGEMDDPTNEDVGSGFMDAIDGAKAHYRKAIEDESHGMAAYNRTANWADGWNDRQRERA